MKFRYKINKKEIRNSLKYLIRDLYELPIIIVGVILFLHFIKALDFVISFKLGFTFTLGLYLLTKIIPTLIMHLIHHNSNKGVELEIDKLNEIIKIKKDREFIYRYSELAVLLYLPIYHKNKVDKMMRLATGWSNYSFIRIKTKDNKEFNISSILIRKEEFPIEPSEVKYSLWPSIGKWYENTQILLDDERNRLSRWKDKFSTLTIEQIDEKLRDSERFDVLPRKALIELRNEKTGTDKCNESIPHEPTFD
ncbi:MAG: hypothetical protein ACFCUU_09425 [Cyclobacteriaceae bacterium]